ncbi:MAG: hypothetical protein H7Y89_01980 [Steroidobacteraceae bacterium]|nr:hypothetical protein [Steroidobacteraceae bacterium]
MEGIDRSLAELVYRPGAGKHVAGSLLAFSKLRALWVYGADATLVAEVAELKRLEGLSLERMKTAEIAPLGGMQPLRSLALCDSSQAASLETIANLDALQVLEIHDMSGVNTLEWVKSLASLRTLAFEGSPARRATIDSLSPISGLSDLENLFITTLVVEDRSLEPVVALKKLRVMQSTNYFPSDEFKRLSEANPALKCSWTDTVKKYGSLEASPMGMAKAKLRTRH